MVKIVSEKASNVKLNTLLIAVALISIVGNANAQSFVENNWKYDVVSNSELTIKLIGRCYPNNSWPSITEIPSTVVHNGITFTVTQIGKKVTHWEGNSNGSGYYRSAHNYGNGMTDIILPSTITTIEDSAFWGCTNLSNITFQSIIPPTMGTNVFSGVPLYAFLYVPCGRITMYSTYSGLNQFSHFTEVGTYGILTAQANNSEYGTVTITQEPTCTTPAIVEASNIVHHNVSGAQYTTSYYHFTSWDDGNTSNPRTLFVTDDTTITALFEPNMYYCTGSSNDTNQGIVIGDSVAWMDTAYITAIPKYGYRFAYWEVWTSPGSHLNNYTNPYPRVCGSSTVYQLKAFFTNDTFNVVGNSDGGGSVRLNYTNSSSGVFSYLSEITIQAYPLEGNRFVMWDDGVLFQNRTFTLTSDTSFYAIFTPIASLRDTIYDTVYVHDTTIINHFDTIWLHDTIVIHDTIYVGVDDMENANAKIYTSQGQIVVEGADGNEVSLFDVNGRVLATKQDYGAEIRFDVTGSGTYIIKIGNYLAKKVVVVQ